MTVPILPALIGGRAVLPDDGRAVHTVHARALIDDTFPTLRLKQDLDAGRRTEVPDDRVVVGACSVADEAMAEQAVDAAAKAAPEWRRVPLADRMDIGRRIAARLTEQGGPLIDLLVAEGTPRGMAEGIVYGIPHTTWSEETLGWCAEQMEFRREHDERSLLLRRVADGVVCLNPPQNAATVNVLNGLTSVLAGNTAVIRAPRGVGLSCMHLIHEIVAPVLDEAGAPPGTVNAMCAPPLLESWVANPQVDDILYYGGSQTGMQLERDCIAAGKKPVLELAGNDCCVVWHDADLDRAVPSLAQFFMNSGQICNVPNQVVVHPDVAEEVIERLVAEVAGIRPGYPDDRDVVLTPVLGVDWFFGCLGEALAKGAALVHGGRRLEVDGSVADTGMFVEPTIVRIDGLRGARELSVVRDETFFPLLPIIVPETGSSDDALLTEVLHFVDHNAYGLRNSVWSRDERVISRALDGITQGGNLKINDSHGDFLPFLPNQGGTGLTGGVFGEASHPIMRTTHLQAVSIGRSAAREEQHHG